MAKGKRLTVRPKYPMVYFPKRLRKPGKRLAEEQPVRFPVGTAAAVGLCALALVGAAEFSAAFLMEQDSVDNNFVMGSVAPEVVETFPPGSKIKENVAIRNNGNTPVYIRALVLVTWRDKQGNTMLSPLPKAGKDYEVTGAESGWIEGSDGYYYFTKPVQPGKSTAKLVPKLTDRNTDATRQLSVDIIAQSVQAAPTQAVTEVFQGVTIREDGTLTPPQAVTEVFRDVGFGDDGTTLVPPSMSEGGN